MTNVLDFLGCYIYGIRAIRLEKDLRIMGLLGFFCACWFEMIVVNAYESIKKEKDIDRVVRVYTHD